MVERHMLDGDIVLFNRQPSLHKLSIQAFYVSSIHNHWVPFLCPRNMKNLEGHILLACVCITLFSQEMGKTVTMSFNEKNLQHINMISSPYSSGLDGLA